VNQTDIIEDIIGRIKSEINNSELHVKLDQIEDEIRRTWSGAMIYIAKRNTKQIKEDAINKLNSGLSVKQVSAETGLSISSIYIMLRRKK